MLVDRVVVGAVTPAEVRRFLLREREVFLDEWRVGGEVVALGMRSIVAGTLATCLTAAAVALVL